ncbi:Centrin-1 [Trichinella nelsoni]|uniref:Centrin-1 n=1 Tax=Trichinella nelsoni TaxID=6336 RepID=A0A0V0RKI7_9BILA|nr:Centrin-1 [Trichinella nelsoni]
MLSVLRIKAIFQIFAIDKIAMKRKLAAVDKEELNEEQKQEVKQAFQSCCPDETGRIRSSNLKLALRALGFEPKSTEVRQMLHSVELAENGKISLQEFMDMVTEKMIDTGGEKQMVKAYSLFVGDDPRGICLSDLKRMAKKLGEAMSESELKEMIDEADLNHDGVVDLSEFINIMKKTIIIMINETMVIGVVGGFFARADRSGYGALLAQAPRHGIADERIDARIQIAEHVGGDFEQKELLIPDFDYAKVDPDERNVVRQPAEEQSQRQHEHQRGDTPPLPAHDDHDQRGKGEAGEEDEQHHPLAQEERILGPDIQAGGCRGVVFVGQPDGGVEKRPGAGYYAGQAPNEQRIAGCHFGRSERDRFQRIAQGKVPVDGHDRQQPDAGEHGDVLEEVGGLAHPESVRPVVQHVDGPLERHAEYQEQQIGTAEVQNEHSGRVQPNYDQHVAQDPDANDQHQEAGDRPLNVDVDERGRVGLVDHILTDHHYRHQLGMVHLHRRCSFKFTLLLLVLPPIQKAAIFFSQLKIISFLASHVSRKKKLEPGKVSEKGEEAGEKGKYIATLPSWKQLIKCQVKEDLRRHHVWDISAIRLAKSNNEQNDAW